MDKECDSKLDRVMRERFGIMKYIGDPSPWGCFDRKCPEWCSTFAGNCEIAGGCKDKKIGEYAKAHDGRCQTCGYWRQCSFGSDYGRCYIFDEQFGQTYSLKISLAEGILWEGNDLNGDALPGKMFGCIHWRVACDNCEHFDPVATMEYTMCCHPEGRFMKSEGWGGLNTGQTDGCWPIGNCKIPNIMVCPLHVEKE